ncbi:hypothetical protein [Pseudoalteromonas rhizosphaerae]|uniref:hypothetical protein n=1 Tax=Pseudoalteromonas rhizosphaerae TaxID=2518973 RepID=UPI00384B75A6
MKVIKGISVKRGDGLAYVHVTNRFATLAAAQNVPDILSNPSRGFSPSFIGVKVTDIKKPQLSGLI